MLVALQPQTVAKPPTVGLLPKCAAMQWKEVEKPVVAQPRTVARLPMGGTAVDACGDAGSSDSIGSGVGVSEVGITGGVWGSDSREAVSRVSLFIGSVYGETGGNMA
jgi:hypothetical protein